MIYCRQNPRRSPVPQDTPLDTPLDTPQGTNIYDLQCLILIFLVLAWLDLAIVRAEDPQGSNARSTASPISKLEDPLPQSFAGLDDRAESSILQTLLAEKN